MGVEGLTAIVEPAVKKVNLFRYRNSTIVVDTNNIVSSLLSLSDVELRNYFTFLNIVASKSALKFIFVFDGTHHSDKIKEVIRRRNDGTKKACKFFSEPNQYKIKRGKLLNFERFLMCILKSLNFQCVRAVYEADPLVASLARTHGATFIMSSDSDFYLSDVPYVIKADEFCHLIKWKAKKGRLDNIRSLYVDCVDTKMVDNYCLQFNRDFYPIFSALAGNDYTKSFAPLFTHKIEIFTDNTLKTDIRDIVKFLRTFKRLNQLVEYIHKQSKEKDEKFFQAIEMTRMVAEPSSEIEKETAQLEMDHLAYQTCAKYFGNTIELLNPDNIAFSEIHCDPKRKPLYLVEQPIRAIIFGFNTEEIVTENEATGDVYGTVKTTPTRLMKYTDFIKKSSPERIDIVLKGIFGTNEAIFKLWNNVPCDDVWKAMVVTLFAWLKKNSDFSEREIQLGFHTAAQLILDPTKRKMYSIKKDQRSATHVFTAYNIVSYDFLELFIDYCDVPSFNVEKIHIEPAAFIQYYSDVPFTENEFDQLVKSQDIYKSFAETVLKNNFD
ncbi:hypothetical protein EIN_309180 [Entamoeba invadens IP1]|uniref:XPG N-terminal domain-containing protein n=1 Tax=Entamoeba invadens IP1 TaxID=370355 RepID=A0A0A1TZ06_ENTIV|nr:hypothetical protein EIN_309180 [Entamoeba invadens IP1]ELP84945.1 hypothetical protein EIN_309180 [Entamoeba invadens IP1]|eukprot:XP_004184291.1 hypothetical protein EIN_309180 [Entamoeba invadens IP1]